VSSFRRNSYHICHIYHIHHLNMTSMIGMTGFVPDTRSLAVRIALG